MRLSLSLSRLLTQKYNSCSSVSWTDGRRTHQHRNPTQLFICQKQKSQKNVKKSRKNVKKKSEKCQISSGVLLEKFKCQARLKNVRKTPDFPNMPEKISSCREPSKNARKRIFWRLNWASGSADLHFMFQKLLYRWNSVGPLSFVKPLICVL